MKLLAYNTLTSWLSVIPGREPERGARLVGRVCGGRGAGDDAGAALAPDRRGQQTGQHGLPKHKGQILIALQCFPLIVTAEIVTNDLL